MNGGIGYFLNCFLSYLFSFYPACSLQFILQWCAWLLSSHSSRHCFPLFGAVSWNWEKAFGVVWLILPPLTLCSPQQRCSQYFSSCPGSVVIRRVSEIINATRFSNDLLSTPGFPTRCDFHIKTEAKDFHPINNDKALHLHSSTNSNPPFKYSHTDFYLPHIHIC